MRARTSAQTRTLRRPTRRLVAARLLSILAVLLLSGPSLPREAVASPVQATEEILLSLAHHLGWPAAILARPDVPGNAMQVSEEGKAQCSPLAMISVMQNADEPTLLDVLEQRGMSRGVFHGREAIIVRAGDGAAVAGIIAWRCGPYVLVAEDATGSGREVEIAEALYAATEQSLCGIASDLVILAETTDTPGASSLGRFRDLAQAADWYYSINGYGRVGFSLSFMDADGAQGPRDWYNVGPRLAAYAGDERAFALAALQKALAGAKLPATVYLERAIVICPADAKISATRPLLSSAFAQGSDYYLEVPGAEHRIRVYLPSVVLLSEEDDLGSWVHELGHTLYAKYATQRGHHRIDDRYAYGDAAHDFGQVGVWDLMGSGSRWGNPIGTSPVQMCSYTKEAAGWLRYRPAQLGGEYELTALEHQEMGEDILRLDDPLSDDPLCYYILEARDSGVFFGAPESGVMIYHVTYDHVAGHAVVSMASPQHGDTTASQSGATYMRPTLHGLAQAGGAREYVNEHTGFKVVLLAESFSPYHATVRVERHNP